jgi:hypothetical protein
MTRATLMRFQRIELSAMSQPHLTLLSSMFLWETLIGGGSPDVHRLDRACWIASVQLTECEMEAMMRGRHHDLPSFQGNDAWMLPIPATFVSVGMESSRHAISILTTEGEWRSAI